jgi:xanthine/CO dehydrogenase XdhC/CoxF family maturation factor
MVRLLEQGESFAVATIFDKAGSAPRSAGAKMVVRADGSIFGSIGGVTCLRISGPREAGKFQFGRLGRAEDFP